MNVKQNWLKLSLVALLMFISVGISSAAGLEPALSNQYTDLADYEQLIPSPPAGFMLYLILLYGVVGIIIGYIIYRIERKR